MLLCGDSVPKVPSHHQHQQGLLEGTGIIAPCSPQAQPLETAGGWHPVLWMTHCPL